MGEHHARPESLTQSLAELPLVWAIVPVKPFDQAKSRLSSVMTPGERAALAERLFRRMLGVLGSVSTLAGVLVVSRDETALAIGRALGTVALQERGLPELNAALGEAVQAAAGQGAQAILILPADLPLIRAQDVAQVVSFAHAPQQIKQVRQIGTAASTAAARTVLIAPDRAGEGTNGLLLVPPEVIPLAFGAGSFARHVQAAEAAGAVVHVYRSPYLALDVDTPSDLADLARLRELDSA